MITKRIRKILHTYKPQICPLCGRPLKGKLNIDHKTPKSKGGSDCLSNLQLTHKKCNNAKANNFSNENDTTYPHMPSIKFRKWHISKLGKKLLQDYENL